MSEWSPRPRSGENGLRINSDEASEQASSGKARPQAGESGSRMNSDETSEQASSDKSRPQAGESGLRMNSDETSEKLSTSSIPRVIGSGTEGVRGGPCGGADVEATMGAAETNGPVSGTAKVSSVLKSMLGKCLRKMSTMSWPTCTLGVDTGGEVWRGHWERTLGRPTSETVADIDIAQKRRERNLTHCVVVVCWVRGRRANHELIWEGNDGLPYVTGMLAIGRRGGGRRWRRWRATADTAAAARAREGRAFMMNSVGGKRRKGECDVDESTAVQWMYRSNLGVTVKTRLVISGQCAEEKRRGEGGTRKTSRGFC